MAGIWRNWKRIWLLSLASSVGLLFGMGEAASQDEDDAAWQRARTAGSAQAFQEYLDRFPTGRYSAAAFSCIVVQARGFEAEGCGAGQETGPLVGRSLAPAVPVGGATAIAPGAGPAGATPAEVY